ncbi:MAG TPA: GntR family transcriptional regulator [Burkholderiaceae bacterium]|nr:GntR family transcriptional regulator [Burkholderiaceae bacterium]
MSANADAIDLQPRSLASIVLELEEDIVLGVLHPRERLVEDELMLRFGVRRHIVRAALAQLAHMGLVEHRKNIGALVRSYERDEVIDLYGVRELLEGQAAALMPCPPDAAALRRMEALQRVHDQAVKAHDARAIFRANMAFHAALFSLCPNKVLVDAIDYYARQTHAIRFGSAGSSHTQARSRAEHHAILRALKAGQRDDLVRLCKDHIMPSRDEYLSAISG